MGRKINHGRERIVPAPLSPSLLSVPASPWVGAETLAGLLSVYVGTTDAERMAAEACQDGPVTAATAGRLVDWCAEGWAAAELE